MRKSNEIDVLAYFEARPTSSLNYLKQETGLRIGSIHQILKDYKFVPYIYRPTQKLVTGDQQRINQFSQ